MLEQVMTAHRALPLLEKMPRSDQVRIEQALAVLRLATKLNQLGVELDHSIELARSCEGEAGKRKHGRERGFVSQGSSHRNGIFGQGDPFFEGCAEHPSACH